MKFDYGCNPWPEKVSKSDLSRVATLGQTMAPNSIRVATSGKKRMSISIRDATLDYNPLDKKLEFLRVVV